MLWPAPSAAFTRNTRTRTCTAPTPHTHHAHTPCTPQHALESTDALGVKISATNLTLYNVNWTTFDLDTAGGQLQITLYAHSTFLKKNMHMPYPLTRIHTATELFIHVQQCSNDVPRIDVVFSCRTGFGANVGYNVTFDTLLGDINSISVATVNKTSMRSSHFTLFRSLSFLPLPCVLYSLSPLLAPLPTLTWSFTITT